MASTAKSYEEYSKQVGGGQSFQSYMQGMGAAGAQNADIAKYNKEQAPGYQDQFLGMSGKEYDDASGRTASGNADPRYNDYIYGSFGTGRYGMYAPGDPAALKAQKDRASLTGLQTAANASQPAPTGQTATADLSSPTALSAAATSAVGGGVTPAGQAAQAAAVPAVSPVPTPAAPAAPTPIAAPSAQKFRSKSSLAGLKRAGRRAY